jgi:glycosyltransferase involved in cell wall biosynthesis
LIFRGDSHLLGRSAPPIHVRIALRALYSRFSAFLCVGEANRRYFEAFAVPSAKLFSAPHSVDAELYDHENKGHIQRAKDLRLKLGFGPSTKVVLFAGKLVAAKQPAELLEAFVGLDRPNTALLFVGDGPEKEALVARASSRGRNDIHFLPFTNQSEMPSRYLLADLFVLPSKGVYETWGLAVNEAMHMGVPCLVSNRVGCQRDLVIAGETGWVFESQEPTALGQSLGEALGEISSPVRLAAIRGAVAKKIQNYTYARTTDGLTEALASLRR